MSDTPITKKMYGWTKYGGPRQGLVKEELDEWYCQLCSQKQVKSLPTYLITETQDEREYMRICSKCKGISVSMKIETYEELLSHKVANLLTLSTRYVHVRKQTTYRTHATLQDVDRGQPEENDPQMGLE